MGLSSDQRVLKSLNIPRLIQSNSVYKNDNLIKTNSSSPSLNEISSKSQLNALNYFIYLNISL